MYTFAKDNAPSFICPDTNESYGGSYRLKAGLITADELVYAGESYNVSGNSYLNSGEDGMPYWSMTPTSFYDDGAFVWREFVNLSNKYVDGGNAMRPVNQYINRKYDLNRRWNTR